MQFRVWRCVFALDNLFVFVFWSMPMGELNMLV